MSTGTLVVGAVLTALCIGPFLFLILSGKANSRKIIKLFDIQSSMRELNISEHDSWKNKAIGIDPSKKELLFVQSKKGEVKTVVVKLNDYISCQTNEHYRNTEDSSESIISRITLDFSPAKNKASNLSLEIFDLKTDMDLEAEQVLMKKWVPIIQKELNPSIGSSSAQPKPAQIKS